MVKRVTAGRCRSVTLAGDGIQRVSGSLRAGGFAVTCRVEGDELGVMPTRGDPTIEQVLRLLHQEQVFLADGGAAVAIGEATNADDLAVYTDGTARRLLYRRTWDERGPGVVWVGFNPFLAELQGDPDDTGAAQRKSFQVVYSAAQQSLRQVGRMSIVNLFSSRTASSSDLLDHTIEEAADELIADELSDATAMVCAWGSLGARQLEAAKPRIRRLFAMATDAGVQVATLARGGAPLLTKTGHVRHPSRLAYSGYDLAPLPSDWLESVESRPKRAQTTGASAHVERAGDDQTQPARAAALPTGGSGPSPGSGTDDLGEDRLVVHGYELDLRKLYRAMHGESYLEDDVRIYNGNKRDTEAVKWLLADLFGLPVTAEYNKLYGDARREATVALDRLGWATKVNKHNEPVPEGVVSRTSRYVLHADPDDLG